MRICSSGDFFKNAARIFGSLLRFFRLWGACKNKTKQKQRTSLNKLDTPETPGLERPAANKPNETRRARRRVLFPTRCMVVAMLFPLPRRMPVAALLPFPTRGCGAVPSPGMLSYVPLPLLVASALCHDGRRKERAHARRRVKVDARQRAPALAVGRKLFVIGPVASSHIKNDDVRVLQLNVLGVVMRRALCMRAYVERRVRMAYGHRGLVIQSACIGATQTCP